MISHNPEMKKAGYSVPVGITRELKKAVDAAYRPLSPDAVTVTVELDTEVSNGIRSWCGDKGLFGFECASNRNRIGKCDTTVRFA